MSIQIGERRVEIKELTVGKVRELIEVAERLQNHPEAVDFVADGLLGDLSLWEIEWFTDLKVADVDAMTPSELERVVDACKEANPHFFGWREKMAALGEKLLARQSSESSGPPSP
ncbi:MAG: hypothetical protein HQL51_03925 [Magnetococcales bacterium]|nr:hypothetical protein [Magnetococcales bacterium]